MAKDPGPKPALQVEVVGAAGQGVVLARWLAAVAPARARGHVTVAVTNDSRVRRLNRQFRHIDRATDVLSFPADEPGVLGDVVIARGVARHQARQVGHSLGIELKVLALHGLLHLMGYDHKRDEGQMARVEERLRRRGGLGAGLIARGGRGPRR
jgi:probable rRNA maturation factor